MGKNLKFMYTLLLTMAITLMGSMCTSYADESVEQLIIINSAYNTLNFYENGSIVRKFQCATGKASTPTPQGKTTVANKIVNRPYYKYGIPGGSPYNPLGKRWIGLFDGDTYAVHGTNAPSSIGTNASHGCIRMHNSEVEWLFDQISIGATAIISHSASSDAQIAKNYGVLLGYKWKTVGGNKYFSNSNNVNAKGWNTINGKLYYFDKKGVMQTGLQTIDNQVYYFGTDGVRTTGWQTVDGKKYYLRQKGDKKGQAIIGSTKLAGKNYYFEKDGAMATNKKVKVDKDYYYFGKDGVMVTNEKVKVGNDYYYFGEDGTMTTSNLVKIGDDSYYFEESGVMAISTTIKIANKYCYFKKNGKMLKYGALKLSCVILVLLGIIRFAVVKLKKDKEELAENVN